MYVQYIHYYHRLARAVRTNDINLYTSALTPFIGLFFMTGHINYARWLSKFQLDLLNIDNTHPGLRKLLEAGAFSIRRTEHSFNRIPIDLTVEQTVNADAASRLSGISAMTNNFSARLRWMVTRASRAACVSKLQEMAHMKKKEDVTAELRPSRIMRDGSDLEKVIRKIEECCNPFQEKTVDLYNIYTGKAASKNVTEYLLKVRENGKERHDVFVKECTNDPTRFERAIKREKVESFESECVKNRKSSNKKVAELKCTRDLMGRIAVLASKHNIDLPNIFSYPLTPVPLAMFSTDGTMAKTTKSTLFKELEKKADHGSPLPFDACVVDGNFLLHTMAKQRITTYGSLARSILIQATALSDKRVDIVFDTYAEPSIKDSERIRRNANDQGYLITGPEQQCPRNLTEALKSTSFKQKLPDFLASEWGKPQYKDLISQRQIFLGHSSDCHSFSVSAGTVTKKKEDSLHCNHYEADTRICLHVSEIDKNHDVDNISVRASDTDIAVILIHHVVKLKSKVWMDIGTSGKDSRRFVDITAISQSLGQQMCEALPAFHTFTGSDYTSAFVRKGKVRPLHLLEKNINAQIAFSELCHCQSPSPKTVEALERFTTCLYGAKGEGCSLNKHRYQVVEKAYSPKPRTKNPLDNLKGIDGCCIPPCEAELAQHICRSSFVARMWSTAANNVIDQDPLSTDGWELGELGYESKMFEGPQIPDTILEVMGDYSNVRYDERREDVDEDSQFESGSESDTDDDDDNDEEDEQK